MESNIYGTEQPALHNAKKQPMICPRCGADNQSGKSACYLCNAPLQEPTFLPQTFHQEDLSATHGTHGIGPTPGWNSTDAGKTSVSVPSLSEHGVGSMLSGQPQPSGPNPFQPRPTPAGNAIGNGQHAHPPIPSRQSPSSANWASWSQANIGPVLQHQAADTQPTNPPTMAPTMAQTPMFVAPNSLPTPPLVSGPAPMPLHASEESTRPHPQVPLGMPPNVPHMTGFSSWSSIPQFEDTTVAQPVSSVSAHIASMPFQPALPASPSAASLLDAKAALFARPVSSETLDESTHILNAQTQAQEPVNPSRSSSPSMPQVASAPYPSVTKPQRPLSAQPPIKAQSSATGTSPGMLSSLADTTTSPVAAQAQTFARPQIQPHQPQRVSSSFAQLDSVQEESGDVSSSFSEITKETVRLQETSSTTEPEDLTLPKALSRLPRPNLPEDFLFATKAELPSLWSRALAGMVDLTLLFVLATAVARWFGPPITSKLPPGIHIIDWLTLFVQHYQAQLLFFGKTFVAFYIVYSSVLHAWGGKTLGKRIFSLKTVNVSGRPLGWFGAVARSIAFLLFFALNLVGVLWILLDQEYRGLHDRVCGTLVIKDKPVA